jgi:transcriptional regulator with XRE-family HTH domain
MLFGGWRRMLWGLQLQDHRGMAGTEIKVQIGLRLKAARMALGYDKKRGRTQAAFYRLFGIDRGRANNWERGRVYPNTDFLVMLNDRFEVDPGWILAGKRGGLPDRIADKVVENFRKIVGDYP